MATEELQDLTDRVFLLRDYLEKGRIKIAEHLWDGFVASLEKIKLDADGFVVPESVDSRKRHQVCCWLLTVDNHLAPALTRNRYPAGLSKADQLKPSPLRPSCHIGALNLRSFSVISFPFYNPNSQG